MLKRLKLCGCINIEGHGLNPLIGSVVLEQIDFSLVKKHEKQKIESKPRISLEAIVFVLDSIISLDNCALKYIQFPDQWHTDLNKPSKDQLSSALTEFRQRYNSQFQNRSFSCLQCNRDVQPKMTVAMFQDNTCYNCLRHVCEDCSTSEEDLGDGDIGTRDLFLKFCDNCEKDYCKDCFVPPRGYEETEYCGVCRPCYDCYSENGEER